MHGGMVAGTHTYIHIVSHCLYCTHRPFCGHHQNSRGSVVNDTHILSVAAEPPLTLSLNQMELLCTIACLLSKSVFARVENEFLHLAVDAPDVKACLKAVIVHESHQHNMVKPPKKLVKQMCA